MEIIMQWLDDVEDVVLVTAQILERLRWPCLKVGFAAACGVAVVDAADPAGAWWPPLAWIALASVGLWAAGWTARELPRPTASVALGKPRLKS